MANSRSRIIRDYSPQIEQYCADNKLSAKALFKSRTGYNNVEGSLFIMGKGDAERGKLGLMDDVPLPVALEVYLENGQLRFVQTEHTKKFLSEGAA